MVLHNTEQFFFSANLHTKCHFLPLICAYPEEALIYFPPNVHVMFFFLYIYIYQIHWLIYVQAIHHQRGRSDRIQKKEKREGMLIILNLLKSGLTNARYFKSLYKFSCLRCYFSLPCYSFILLVYTFNFPPSSYQVLYSLLFHWFFFQFIIFTVEAVVVFLSWKD